MVAAQVPFVAENAPATAVPPGPVSFTASRVPLTSSAVTSSPGAMLAVLPGDSTSFEGRTGGGGSVVGAGTLDVVGAAAGGSAGPEQAARPESARTSAAASPVRSRRCRVSERTATPPVVVTMPNVL